MKKIFACVLASVILLSGCSTNSTPSQQSSQPNESQVSGVESVANTSSDVSNPESPEKSEVGEVVIYLTRHGKTMLNNTDRVQGWADSPLTVDGVEIAEYLGKGLKIDGIKFDAAYSSDSGRAIETANIVLDQIGQLGEVELKELKGLREWNFGKFEGEYNDIMLEEVAKAVGYEGEEDIRTALSTEEFADGIAKADETGSAEDWKAISSRLDESFRQLADEVAQNGGGNVLVVAHGLTINGILKGLDPESTTQYVPNAAVAKIIYSDGQFTIETVNDESYIQKGKS